MGKLHHSAVLAFCATTLFAAPLLADEGMWTFDNLPLKRFQETYGFAPTTAWLERLRLASVRFNDGGSGSFVSVDGLMVTNHHVGLQCIQNLSTTGQDFVAEGYLAPSRDKEAACPGYEVNVLVATEDISPKVLGAVKPEMSDKAAWAARQAAIAGIEKGCAEKTGLRCDVVTLYQNSEYHLYTYKKYTDVRLVFAPEEQIASFGGDPDNFTFPRHDLDVAFFRAYENGRPARPAAFLPWGAKGVKEGDLVFVAGNPGSTSRLATQAQLESLRDVQIPDTLRLLKRRLAMLRAYSAKSPEHARRAVAVIRSLENSEKAYQGMLAALRDANAMARRAAAESALREKVASDAALAKAVGDPWGAVAGARKKADARFAQTRYAAFGGTPGTSRLLAIAGQIVRYVAETQKPNEVRLEEYVDSNLASVRNRLYSRAPIHEDLEQAALAEQLQDAADQLGKEHAFTKAALEGKTALEVARDAIAATRLKDVEVRKALVEGGPAAVAASTDALIALARRIDPAAREARKLDEDDVKATITRAGERLSLARWKIYGKTVSPDATFTLRLSYGTVKTYPAEGTVVPVLTTFHGLFDRSAAFGNVDPWNLPKRYADRMSVLDLSTPLNFISTADCVGGSSGSPTVNRDGEFVGIIFDGNIESLALDYFYTDDKARAVSVDARGILEALRKVYGAGAVADELTRR